MTNICLDPGHGGENIGCRYDDIREEEYTFNFCQGLAHNIGMLPMLGPLTITSTRQRIDETVSIPNRGNISNMYEADIVFCVHVNAAENPALRGARVYYLPGDTVAREVGDAYMASLPYQLGRNRLSKSADPRPNVPEDKYLEHCRNVMATHNRTAVLFELAFASNAEDASMLLDEKYQQAMMASMITAITRYQIIKR